MAVEIEEFEITDYDLENEFNPFRKRHRLTKNQQIYGVFAPEDSDDEGSSRPAFGGRKDYTAPISFVGGGVHQAGKKAEKTADAKDDVAADQDTSSDEESMPSTSSARREQRRVPHMSGRRGGFPGPFDNDFGQWEKYTKGVGMKLLLKQGYKPGKGLGKDLQGISEPIEAKLRKGRGAIGAYGTEKTKQQLKKDIQTVDSEEEEEKKFKQQLSQWKKSAVPESKKKVKYVYKTVDEVLSEGANRKIKGDSSHLSKVKVIDMTGPEQRVLSGYHAIHSQHSKPSEANEDRVTKAYQNFALPELTHNLDLLVDMTEQDIVRLDRELRFEKDQIINIQYEKQKLIGVLEHENQEVAALETILKIVQNLEERSQKDSENPLTLREVSVTFQRLQKEFYEEYRVYELSDVAVGILLPLLKAHFEAWKPAEDSSYGLDMMAKWKDILEDDSNSTYFTNNKVDPYHQLVWEAWLPRLRTFILTWDCRNCVPLIELVENWMPLLPPWILENILDQVIMPRLQTQVNDWNPLTDEVPIHAWIQPWLPLMASRLDVLYPTIRQKLANGLVHWQPHDPSAKRMLEPWKAVFPRGTLEAFLMKNVLPKIAKCLQEFVINPHQQILDPWQWFIAWENLLPLTCIVATLERHFFPKWLQVLCVWLSNGPNYDEVNKWFRGWKSMFSEQLQNHPVVKEQFNRALDVMNHSVSTPSQGMGGYQTPIRDFTAYLAGLERPREMEAQQPQLNRDYQFLAQAMQNPNATVSLSFKDLVERKAMENGVLFAPVVNRYQEAKQVYQFGPLYIYMDRQVLFVLRGHSWTPISLQALVDLMKQPSEVR